jgi:hypothetical protein
MVNRKDTILCMRNILLDSNIIDECDIAFEGKNFDPNGKELWLKENLLFVDGSVFSNCTDQSTYIYNLGIFVLKGVDDLLYDMLDKLNTLYLIRTEPYKNTNLNCSIFKTEDSNILVDDKYQYINFNIYFQTVQI